MLQFIKRTLCSFFLNSLNVFGSNDTNLCISLPSDTLPSKYWTLFFQFFLTELYSTTMPCIVTELSLLLISEMLNSSFLLPLTILQFTRGQSTVLVRMHKYTRSGSPSNLYILLVSSQYTFFCFFFLQCIASVSAVFV